MSARPNRASSGPASRNEARMRSDRVLSTSVWLTPAALIATDVVLAPFGGRAEPAKEVDHRLDVADPRDVAQHHLLLGEERGRENG